MTASGLPSLAANRAASAPGLAPPPLPRVTAEQVAALNALHRPRAPLALTLGERTLRLTLARQVPAALPIAVGIAIGDAPATLRLCAASLAALSAHLPLRAPLAECPAAPRALWLEYALLAWLEPLEARLGLPLTLLDAAPPPSETAALQLPLRLERDDDSNGDGDGDDDSDAGGGPLALSLSGAALARLAPLWHALGPVTARPWSTLPLPVQWIAGHQTLTLGELRGLAPGDVVLLERPARAVAIAGQLRLEVAEQDRGLRLLGPPAARPGDDLTRPAGAAHDAPRSPFRNHRSRDDMAESSHEHSRKPAPPGVEDALDGLPVRLVCELGRLELTLGELRALDEGSVLPLSRPAEEAVELLVNGRRLGQGRLVAIGDSLGVQIVRLAGDE